MKIAVLEDERDQAEFVTGALIAAGYSCVGFTSGRALKTSLQRDTYDLLLLDWNVPHVSGLEIAQWARAHLSPTPPILMVTSRSSSEDIVAGLNGGADDFLVKPVEAAVLLARVHAVLRRAYAQDVAGRSETYGEYVFDPSTHTVERGDEVVQLTAKEFALALLLFRNLFRAMSRSYLLETIWGRNPDLPTRTLDAHVSRVRTKLGLRPERGYRLAPVYSYGYRLEHFDPGRADDP